jgi:hypothetical protein
VFSVKKSPCGDILCGNSANPADSVVITGSGRSVHDGRWRIVGIYFPPLLGVGCRDLLSFGSKWTFRHCFDVWCATVIGFTLVVILICIYLQEFD